MRVFTVFIFSILNQHIIQDSSHVNLTTTQSFRPLERWSFCFSTPHFEDSEASM